MTINLSPAALAVMDAALETDFEIDFTNLDATLKASIKTVAAAALRAAANDWRVDTEDIDGVEYIRTSTLKRIAAELEAQ